MASIQSTDLRRRVREVLNRVQSEGEPVVVYTYNTPQAVLISYEDFQVYQGWQSHMQIRNAWLAELRAIAEEVSARATLPDEEAGALIEAAIREVRAL